MRMAFSLIDPRANKKINSHKQDNRQKVGPIIFAKPISKAIIAQMENFFHGFQVNIDELYLDSNRLQKHLPVGLLQGGFIQCYQLEHLNKLTIGRNTLLKTKILGYFSLPNLTILDLNGNHISSLEKFSINANFPFLTQLLLYDNKLTSIKDLQRCRFFHLQKLSLDFNFLLQFELAKCQLPQLRILELAANCCSNLRDFYKSSVSPNSLAINSNPGIFDPQLKWSVATKKFVDISPGSFGEQ